MRRGHIALGVSVILALFIAAASVGVTVGFRENLLARQHVSIEQIKVLHNALTIRVDAACVRRSASETDTLLTRTSPLPISEILPFSSLPPTPATWQLANAYTFSLHVGDAIAPSATQALFSGFIVLNEPATIYPRIRTLVASIPQAYATTSQDTLVSYSGAPTLTLPAHLASLPAQTVVLLTHVPEHAEHTPYMRRKPLCTREGTNPWQAQNLSLGATLVLKENTTLPELRVHGGLSTSSLDMRGVSWPGDTSLTINTATIQNTTIASNLTATNGNLTNTTVTVEATAEHMYARKPSFFINKINETGGNVMVMGTTHTNDITSQETVIGHMLAQSVLTAQGVTLQPFIAANGTIEIIGNLNAAGGKFNTVNVQNVNVHEHCFGTTAPEVCP